MVGREKGKLLKECKWEDARLLEVEQHCCLKDDSRKDQRRRGRRKRRRRREEMEKEEEVEKPIVVGETKEICILSNCRLKVCERVWKHGG